MNRPVTEEALIQAIVRNSVRSPLQQNGIHCSDAEIIVVPGQEGSALAVTTDAIVEEIASGLYRDPWLAGWMTVMTNMSDIAAVGAEPLGMLVAQTLPRNMAQHDIDCLHAGIHSALAACSTYLLGGDTNIADRLILAGTALGMLPVAGRLSRLGSRPGDLLYTSGLLGSGNAFAAACLMAASACPDFRPLARLSEGKALRGIASCCMDTSDGVLAALDQLARLNAVGFDIDDGWENVLAPGARATIRTQQLPEWFLLAGCHGEFELLFTVPPEHVQRLHEAAAAIGWHPLRLGTVAAETGVRMRLDEAMVSLDTGRIRGLWDESGGDVQAYIHALLSLDAAV